MKDQVTTLNQAGIHAAYLNSSLISGQYQTAVRNMTLLHMCRIHPRNKEEMMTVSGVGEMKYAKYGEAFLESLQ